jgi:SAM-dependent methyltransferase
MPTLSDLPTAAAPVEWSASPSAAESRLHQIAPYIGKLKPVIARELISRFTAPGDLVLDCFAGSGTVPLEALLLGRRVIALDRSPYAVTLTRAKLEAPRTTEAAVAIVEERLRAAAARPVYDLDAVPAWVREFFHPETLQEALRFADECIAQDDQFLLACLLGILHHQRPGFLSYPSSHLVPYLRDRKFPRSEYPEMYVARALRPRLLAKVRRALKLHVTGPLGQVVRVGQEDVRTLDLEAPVDAIVTSPPYMNALDYVRDNRLRMWFLDRSTTDYSPEPTDKPQEFDALTSAFARRALGRLRSGGRCVLIVGQTVLRKRMTSHPAERILAQLMSVDESLTPEQVIEDDIPDVRRSRRDGAATKRELILVIQKG